MPGAAFGLGAVTQLLQKRRKALAHRGLVAEHAVIERKEALRCVAEAVLAHMVGRSAARDDRGEDFYDQRETVALVRAGRGAGAAERENAAARLGVDVVDDALGVGGVLSVFIDGPAEAAWACPCLA